MQFISYPFDSKEYQQALALRQTILRKPLGLTLSAQDTLGEQNQWHFGVIQNTGLLQNQDLIACIIAKPMLDTNGNSQLVKLRQMAVDANYQGLGVGKMLMQGVEKHLLSRGIQHIELNARLTAVGFYTKFGYTVRGEIFTEVSIEHLTMVKTLQP